MSGNPISLIESTETVVDFNKHKVKIVARSATLKDFKTIQGEFLKLMICMKSGEDFKMVDGIDKVVSALTDIYVGEQKIYVDAVPIELLAYVVEATIDQNFTPSKLSQWHKVFEKIQKAMGTDQKQNPGA